MTKRNYAKEPLRIFISVGHGGPDPGAVNGVYRESDCNLAIAMLMEQDLQRHGIQVKLSRYADVEDRLREEIAACNAYKPDFAISIHTNASADGKASGFEVYHQQANWRNGTLSQRMAELLNKNVSKYLHVNTRGLKTNNHLGWLKQVDAPCVLCENFFINGPKVAWYCAPAQLSALSKAYTRAILEFYGLVYRSNETFMLHYKIVQNDLQTAKNYQCSALLIDGNNYVNLRELAKALDWGVHFDETSKKILLYPLQYYAESQFQDGLLKLSDFPTKAEQIMAGLFIENTQNYAFDEYDYTDHGQLEQIQQLQC